MTITAPAVTHPSQWRRCSFHFSRVRPDDHPHRCPLCHSPVLVGQHIITQRSASPSTPRCYGPIEQMYHSACWVRAGEQGLKLPPLGRDVDLWARWVTGDAYPWSPAW